MQAIAIINGPNLNLLGTRETDIYGSESFDTYLPKLRNRFPDLRIELFQSNIEGELINSIQEAAKWADGIVLNAAGYSHTSVALGDAVAAVSKPVVEVHISNVLAREAYRKTSFIASKCVGSISGLGLKGYQLAIEYFLNN